jgi:cystathionine beta-synthase
MVEPLPEVPWEASYSEISGLITKQIPAVLTRDKAGAYHIITQYDLIQNL